jgi:hypothetical protein
MSRSRKKTPIGGITTASSDARWKAMASRTLRHRVKIQLEQELHTDSFAGKRWDAVDPWTSEKDGKSWFGDSYPVSMRK